MKKLKLNLPSNKEIVLTRDQLKKVMGGDINEFGSCVEYNGSCNTQKAINCCNTLTCADWVCKRATI